MGVTRTLDLVVESFLAGDWRDLSSRLIGGQPITVRRGSPDGAAQAASSTYGPTLDDDDGWLTPLNALGEYFPAVRRGVRSRMAIRHSRDLFARTASNGWGDADGTWPMPAGRSWTPTAGSASNYGVAAGIATHTHGVRNELRATALDASLRNCDVVVDVATSAALTGGALVSGVLVRYDVAADDYYWARVEFDHNSTDVILKISKAIGGSTTELAVLDPVPGLAYTAGGLVRMRASVAGSRLAVKVWAPAGPEPLDWQLEASDDELTEPGQVGTQSWLVGTNTNTLPVTARFSGFELLVMRGAGTIGAYRPRIVPVTGGDTVSAMSLDVGGITRRLERGKAPPRSAPARYLPTTSPLGCWFLEDGALSTIGAPAAGRYPMRPFVGTHPSGAVLTTPQWGQGTLGPWLPPVVSRSGSGGFTVLWAQVDMPATSSWTIDSMWAGGSDVGDSSIDINPSYLPGGALGWPQLLLGPSFGGVDVAMNGEPEVTAVYTPLYDGNAHHIRWTATQSGSKVAWGVWVDGVLVNGTSTSGNMTLPAISTIGLLAAAEGAQLAQGYVGVWTSPPTLADAVAAALGYPGEPAGRRIKRVCSEESLPLQTVGDLDDTMLMGPQPTDKPIAIVRESAATDLGILGEAAGDVALTYMTRVARENQWPSLTVNLATYSTVQGTSADVLAPVYDDQGLVNDMTVSRRDGASAQVVDDDSADADGVYDSSAEVNVASDDQLTDIAAWTTHLGTVDELRNPNLALDVGNNPALLDAWLSTDIGNRVQRVGVPARRGGGVIDQLMDGYAETLGPKTLTVAANCSPASGWDVAAIDGDQVVPADGSTIGGSGLADGALSFTLVSTLDNGPWVTGDTLTNPTDYPQQLLIGGPGGEVVTVSGISGATPIQTATLSSRGDNGVTRQWPAGTSVDALHPAVPGL